MRCLKLLVTAVAFSAMALASPPKDYGKGTWKLNVDKSDYGSLPKPKAITIEVTQSDGKTLAWTLKGTDPSGNPMDESWSGAPDGQERLVAGTNGEKAGFEWKGDSLVIHVSLPKGTVIDETVTISDDKKTMSIDETIKGEDGENHVKSVYDRVK